MKNVVETTTALVLIISWKAEVAVEEESKHQRSGVSHSENSRDSSETSLAFWGTHLSLLVREDFSSLTPVCICPLTAEPVAHGSDQHGNDIFAFEERVWATTAIFLFPSTCGNSLLLLTGKGRAWHFSVWNGIKWMYSYWFNLVPQRAGIFYFLFLQVLFLWSRTKVLCSGSSPQVRKP